MLTRQVLSIGATSPAFGFTRTKLCGTATQCLRRSGGGGIRVPAPTFGSVVVSFSRRHLSFSFAGPRVLDEIIKKDLLESKSSADISHIWLQYHESRENVHGLIYKGKEGKDILSRAASCPFFVQPIFRDDGFFMMISQFQEPSHFLMAYLEDYKMDPSAAQPLLTFSVFDDYAETRDLTLVRCDILNKGLHDNEGRKIVENTLDSYMCDVEFATVKTFNQRPNSFDVDDFISRQNEKWRKDPPSIPV